MLSGTSEIIILIVLAALFFAATHLAYLLGVRHSKQSDEFSRTHVSSLQGGLLGLLALLLGFTFAMAVQRHETRRSLVIEEANAIGTTHLRSSFLTTSSRERVQALLREYVDARLEFYFAGVNEVRIVAAERRAAHIQGELWQAAVTAAEADARSIPAGLFVESLNDTIDLGEARQAAMRNHVPETVLYLLFFVASGALGFIAYGCGLARRRHVWSTTIFTLLVALVPVLIIDMDRPRRGLIKVSQESMLLLQASLKSPTQQGSPDQAEAVRR